MVRKVDVRLPGKMNSNSHGATLVHQIITMMKHNRTNRLSIKNSLSLGWQDLSLGPGTGGEVRNENAGFILQDLGFRFSS